MLTRMTIRNFQSLKKVDLEFGQFTVIVGPSSSGKSALMRACRAIASNLRGSGVITRGQKQLAIIANTDTAQIALERTESASTYKLVVGGPEVTFTKLAGAVPDQVTKALRIQPVTASGTSVNFASQFDRPFLLDDTGANVARTLGALTNVTAIFEAVRQANKIRLAAASKLKVRQSDLEQVKTKLAAFQGLGDRLIALKQAEELTAQALDLQARADRLTKAIATLRLAELTALSAEKLPEVPDITPLLAAHERYQTLIVLLREIVHFEDLAREQQKIITTAEHNLTIYENDRQRRLHDAKVCPTCGQATT